MHMRPTWRVCKYKNTFWALSHLVRTLGIYSLIQTKMTGVIAATDRGHQPSQQPNLDQARRDGLCLYQLVCLVSSLHTLLWTTFNPMTGSDNRRPRNRLAELVPKQNELRKHIKSRLGNWSSQASYKTSSFQRADVRRQPTNDKLKLQRHTTHVLETIWWKSVMWRRLVHSHNCILKPNSLAQSLDWLLLSI